MDMVMEKAPAAPRSSPGGGWSRRIFGIVAREETYLELLYLVLSFPIGLAAFIVLTTFVSVGLGLAVTLVGIPILVATMYGWCLAADADRALTNLLLGTRIPRMPFASRREVGLLRRTWDRATNPYTWRSLLYLLLRFPHGIITFTAATMLIGVPLMAFSLPFHYWAHDVEVGPNWVIDTPGEALLFAIPAPFVLLAGLHALSLLARGSGLATGWILGSNGEPLRAEPTATVHEVAAWRGLSLSGTLEGAASRLQSSQVAAFRWHATFSGALMVLLVLINVASGSEYAWSVWGIWGLSIPLAVHAGYLLRGWIGAHVGLFAIINVGLFGIDANYSEGWWFYWPLIGWGFLLALSLFASRALRKPTDTVAATSGTSAAPASGVASGPAPQEASAATEPGIDVDVEMRRVTVLGTDIELTPKEFDLLVLLFTNPGRPFNRGELLDRIWDNDYEVTDRTVDATVVRLRRKLGARAEDIQTVWGVGYRYSPGT